MPSRRPLVLRADELAAACSGRVAVGDRKAIVAGFTIDSRRVQTGDLFVAIRGARFDGHQFVADALRAGAMGIVVSDISATDLSGDGSVVVIVVDDTTRALQELGHFVRRQSRARVVAITGSVGKTTTKELIAASLTGSFDVFRNEGNLNNHIGVPLSLLELRHQPEVAVVELGMNHAGEIRRLVEIAEPDVRVWTNVAEVHSAFFASIEAIADAKAEILDGASAETELVANAGDHRVMNRVAQFPGVMTTFGVDTEADVRATNVQIHGLDGVEATIQTPSGVASVRTPLLGRGHVANVAAAVAVALRCQVPLDLVVRRLASCGPQPGRGQVLRLDGLTLVDDTYNSSPTALRAALDAVGRAPTPGRRIAVLGEMLELGERSKALHEACGRAAVEAGFGLVIAVGGAPAAAFGIGACAAGLNDAAVATFQTSEEAIPAVLAAVREGDVILIKGSRGIGMDRIVDRLKATH